MKNFQFPFCSVLLATLFFVVGCIGPTHHPDPLPASKGWRRMDRGHLNLDHKIISDYQDYIQHLPPGERNQLTESSIHYFGNANGQYAILFEIVRDGFLTNIDWTHVLIYDVNNKRIKTMRYRSGRSLS